MYTSKELSSPVEGNTHIIEREDGTRLKAIVRGRGEQDIVLAHGYGASMLHWNIISRMLDEEKYRLIVFDQRGHGASTIGRDGISSTTMASDYKAILEAFDVQNGVLGGHSMGGFLAQKFLLSWPEVAKARLKGCLLIATFAGDVNRDNFQNRFQVPLVKSGILVTLSQYKPIAHAFSRSLVGDVWYEAMSDAFMDIFRQTNHRALVPILSAFGDENYYAELNNISIPCTIIVGSKDRSTPALHTDEMHSNIPDATVVKVPGVGHIINWEAPEALVAELVNLADG